MVALGEVAVSYERGAPVLTYRIWRMGRSRSLRAGVGQVRRGRAALKTKTRELWGHSPAQDLRPVGRDNFGNYARDFGTWGLRPSYTGLWDVLTPAIIHRTVGRDNSGHPTQHCGT